MRATMAFFMEKISEDVGKRDCSTYKDLYFKWKPQKWLMGIFNSTYQILPSYVILNGYWAINMITT